METSTLLIHKCPHCKSTYKNQEFLMKHIESHTKKIFSCIICGINYNCRKSYNRHISIKHTDNKIECNNCGRKYSRKEHLKRHLCGSIPIKMKNFSCRYCGRRFHRKDVLKKHEKIH